MHLDVSISTVKVRDTCVVACQFISWPSLCLVMAHLVKWGIIYENWDEPNAGNHIELLLNLHNLWISSNSPGKNLIVMVLCLLVLQVLLKKMEKSGGVFVDSSKWKRKWEAKQWNFSFYRGHKNGLLVLLLVPPLLCFCRSLVTIALTFLTSSQAILIAWSRKAGKYDYSVTTANFLVGKWYKMLIFLLEFESCIKYGHFCRCEWNSSLWNF